MAEENRRPLRERIVLVNNSTAGNLFIHSQELENAFYRTMESIETNYGLAANDRANVHFSEEITNRFFVPDISELHIPSYCIIQENDRNNFMAHECIHILFGEQEGHNWIPATVLEEGIAVRNAVMMGEIGGAPTHYQFAYTVVENTLLKYPNMLELLEDGLNVRVINRDETKVDFMDALNNPNLVDILWSPISHWEYIFNLFTHINIPSAHNYLQNNIYNNSDWVSIVHKGL